MSKRVISLPAMLVFIFVLAGSEAVVADPSPGKTLVGTWQVSIISGGGSR